MTQPLNDRPVDDLALPQGTRYVDVVTVQGDEAYPLLDQIGQGWQGRADVLNYLAEWDYGDETTQAQTILRGDKITEPGWGSSDHLYRGRCDGDDYMLSWDANRSLYVSLTRLEPPSPAADQAAASIAAQQTAHNAPVAAPQPAPPVIPAALTAAQTAGLGR